MPRELLILAGLVSLATAAAAQDGAKVSLGYAYLKYLETDGDSTPTGAYLSMSGGGKTTWELDAAYHHETNENSSHPFLVKTFTLMAGPKFSHATRGSTKPYLHLLGGLRHDRFGNDSNTGPGGMAGIGVDVRTSGNVGLRLGADFQLFRGSDFPLFQDDGQNLTTLRLTAGLTF